MRAKEERGEIRRLLKLRCRTLRVEAGSGSASSWINIGGSGEGGFFTEAEKTALRSLGIPFGALRAVIAPESRGFWFAKLKAIEDDDWLPDPEGTQVRFERGGDPRGRSKRAKDPYLQ